MGVVGGTAAATRVECAGTGFSFNLQHFLLHVAKNNFRRELCFFFLFPPIAKLQETSLFKVELQREGVIAS